MKPTQRPIPGWGIDLPIDRRPGVPLQQEFHVDHDTLEGRSPVTTTVPLKGLSGVIRRAAYRLPDWKPRRWMMLMAADRVDVLESRLTWRKLFAAGGAIALLTALVYRAKRR